MVFAYVRVSTDRQTNENQRYEMQQLALRRGLTIDSFTEETVSGTVKVADRKLQDVLHTLRKGDVLLISELSRLGRTLFMIMQVLQDCMEKEVMIITAKEGYELGDNISSKVLAFAFGLSAEIERNLISQRTKESLARRKAEGMILGRPKGKKTNPGKRKLYDSNKLRDVQVLLQKRVSVSAIARIVGVHRMTLAGAIKEFNLKNPDAKIPQFAVEQTGIGIAVSLDKIPDLAVKAPAPEPPPTKPKDVVLKSVKRGSKRNYLQPSKR